jgi:hypothetical protein
MRMTSTERRSAIVAARAAVEADRIHDTVARNAAMRDLWGVAGYWLTPRTPSTAEFRGESIPLKMIRMPGGRSIRWNTGRFRAAEAWAKKEIEND